MQVIFTPAAEKFIRRMMRMSGGSESGFRLVVTSGGCSGLAATFEVEAGPHPGDAILEQSGLRIFLPVESRLFLEGVTVDFVDSPLQTGFVFHDPKAGSCGCKGEDKAPVVDASGLTLLN